MSELSSTRPSAHARLTAGQLRGVIVPLVTPFTSAGHVDEPALIQLAQGLIAAGVHGLVLAGTTGESPTVRWPEIEAVLPGLIAAIDGRVPLLVGTGTNDTAESVERTRRAKELGADAAFAVTPYYSRPGPAGVLAHYRAIAEVGLPVVAYHIPYRTGLTLDMATLAALLAIPGIVGLKDSSGSVANLAQLAARTRHFGPALLCGEDALFLDALTAGAHGGIVASANLLPRVFVEVYAAFQANDGSAAAKFAPARPVVELLFAEPSPAPLKWALHYNGRLPTPHLRLPLTPVSDALAARLVNALAPRPTAAEIEHLTKRFLDAAVPASEWTHRAHLTVGATLVHRLGPSGALAEMRAGILRLNQAHGTPETPTRGYHETITRAYVELFAAFFHTLPRLPGDSLAARVAAVLASPLADKAALLTYYERDTLYSPAARAGWLPPDRAALDPALLIGRKR
jgi:4-hydroxy-tetrahydrodipicolinate synthase